MYKRKHRGLCTLLFVLCSLGMSISTPVCSYSFSIFSLITYIICSDMHSQQLKHAVIKAGCG